MNGRLTSTTASAPTIPIPFSLDMHQGIHTPVPAQVFYAMQNFFQVGVGRCYDVHNTADFRLR